MTNRIQQTFDDLKAKGEKALIPYIMAGDPSLDVTESLVLTLAEGGADLIELGVPFLIPLPTVRLFNRQRNVRSNQEQR